MKKLKNVLERKVSPRILDIGTGGGGFINLISHVTQKYGEIIGIDVSERAIKAASDNFKDEKISFVKMDAENMSFAENYFDVVCLSNSLHHLDDIKKVVDEMQRVLAPGGYLLFNEMYSDVKSEKQKTHVELHHFWAEVDRINKVTHNETMKRSEIIEVLHSASDLPVIDAWDMVVETGEEQKEISDEDYKFLYNTLDKSLSRVEGCDEYERLQKKAEQLRTRIKNIGFEPAAQLVTVLEKP